MTQIKTGSDQAIRKQSVGLFVKMLQALTFRRHLTGKIPKIAAAEAKLKHTSSAGSPIVEVRDLQKGMGDEVTVDLMDTVQGTPVMGDKRIGDKALSMSFSSLAFKINQARYNIDTGGRMTRQRTVHDLRRLGRGQLAGIMARYEDQTSLIHLAGARGYENGARWTVPLESSPDFAETMVNPVTPPSLNRRFFAGDATSAANLDALDKFSIGTVDDIRAIIDDMENPLQPVVLDGDEAAMDDPLYICYVSTRQWHNILTDTTDKDLRTFHARAMERSKGFKHPLFNGEIGLWNGILVRKNPNPIRFHTGSIVREYAADGTTIGNVVTAVDVDRAIVLGAQAGAVAYGNVGNGKDYFIDWFEERTDKGNRLEVTTSKICGMTKIRFADLNTNIPEDFGVLTIDSYAANPRP